jgi:hypothetical protein
MQSLRVAVAYLCGLLYVGSGTFLFWRYCRSNRNWKEKSRATTALFVTVLGSIFCMLPFVIGDYVGPMNYERRAFLHVFEVHTTFTAFGGIYLGVIAIILLIQVINEA